MTLKSRVSHPFKTLLEMMYVYFPMSEAHKHYYLNDYFILNFSDEILIERFKSFFTLKT